MSSFLVQNGKQAFSDANGRPLVGGKVYFYAPGTNTLKDTWQDSDQTVLNTNPVVLDARGEASIYGGSAYRQVLRDASGNLIWDQILPDPNANLNSFITDLANPTDPLKGAAMVGRSFQVAQNVAEAITYSKSSPGKFVRTLGYYTAGDGGGNDYIIKLTGTPNGGTVIAMADGGFLTSCQNGPMNLRQWGCKGDGATDDTARFLACVSFGATFHVPDGTFMVGPVGPAAVPAYPEGPLAEPNRTSASILKSGQCVTGNGAKSILKWNNATKQAFFYMKDAVNCDVSDVSFVGGYSAMILDPTTNGSVENCGLTRCFMDGQLIGMIGGRQLAIDPTGSRSCTTPYAINCKYKNIVVHGVTMSNCDRPRVDGGDFKDMPGGFCVDFSQGTRGGIMSSLTGNNVLHGVKVESSNVSGGTDTLLASRRCVMSNLNFTNILGLAVLINSANDVILISDSEFHGTINDSSASLISLDSVTGFASNGQCILTNVIATATVGGCLLNGLASGALPTQLIGCNLVGKSFGINNRAPKLMLEDTVISVDPATGNCINTGLSNLNNLDKFTIRGCNFTGNNGLAEQGATTAWRHVDISDTVFNVALYAVYGATLAGGAVWFRLADCKINRAAATSAASVSLPATASSVLIDNQFNLNPASTPSAITVSPSITKSRISGNVSTVGFAISGSDASTSANTNNNITDAVYAVYLP
jgi:hypothetical protein